MNHPQFTRFRWPSLCAFSYMPSATPLSVRAMPSKYTIYLYLQQQSRLLFCLLFSHPIQRMAYDVFWAQRRHHLGSNIMNAHYAYGVRQDNAERIMVTMRWVLRVGGWCWDHLALGVPHPRPIVTHIHKNEDSVACAYCYSRARTNVFFVVREANTQMRSTSRKFSHTHAIRHTCYMRCAWGINIRKLYGSAHTFRSRSRAI